MRPRPASIALWIGLAALTAPAVRAEAPSPIVHTVRFREPQRHTAEVEATFPTGGQAAVELMMPVWSPGYYRVEDHARRVRDLSARAPDGTALAVERPARTDGGSRRPGSPRSSSPTGSTASG